MLIFIIIILIFIIFKRNISELLFWRVAGKLYALLGLVLLMEERQWMKCLSFALKTAVDSLDYALSLNRNLIQYSLSI